jgi:hypothetical protein
MIIYPPISNQNINIIPNFEEIRSYVLLKFFPRNRGYIDITTPNNNSGNNNTSTNTVVGSFYVNKSGQKYYSTNYSDELMGSNNNVYFEGFGIKNIEITLDANKIPQIKITFLDIKSNAINDINSKYAKMFQLPYPIFELEIKGGFGPKIKYRLLKTRDDIEIDTNGDAIITSQFVGDAFAPFSDVLLSYLNAIPFLENNEINLNDNEIKYFYELILSSKRLYQRLDNNSTNKEYIEKENELKLQSEKLSDKINILNLLNNKETIISWFKDNDSFNNISNKNIKNNIINTIQLVEKGNAPKRNLPKESWIFKNNNLTLYENNIINNIIIENIEQYNLDDLIKINYRTSNNILKIETINYINLVSDIDNEREKIFNNLNSLKINKTSLFNQIVDEELGDLKLTIGNVFRLLINDYNILIQKIAQAGIDGGNDTNRNNQFILDKIGYPTVIENNKIVYPGSISQFQTWPEIIFIENFITAYGKALKNNELLNIANSINEDGSSRYIPLNPREIYPNNSKNSELKNPYFGKNINEIFNLLHQRFLTYFNVNIYLNTEFKFNNISLDKDSFYLFDSIMKLFTNSNTNQELVQQDLFKNFAIVEARNIAFALIVSDEKNINKIKQINKNTNFYTNDSIISNSINTSILYRNYTEDYVTIYDKKPEFITSTSNDIISSYINKFKGTTSEDIQFTKDNIPYIQDKKLTKSGENQFNSDYKTGNNFTPNQTHSFLRIGTGGLTLFNLGKLTKRAKYPTLIEVPKGILVTLGLLLNNEIRKNPKNIEYNIDDLLIIKNSIIYDYLIDISDFFIESFNYNITTKINSIGPDDFIVTRKNLLTNDDIINIQNYLYTPVYLSVNDCLFAGITNQKRGDNDVNDVYESFLKLLLPVLSNFLDNDIKEIKDKFDKIDSYLTDNDVKLTIYKSFQTIYETYIYGKPLNEYIIDYDAYFEFVDRAYNNIQNDCIIDINTLISDSYDTDVSIITAISRILTNNNFWFYPFQSFIIGTKNPQELFQINIDNPIKAIPKFLGIYVGGLSSNGFGSETIKDDGVYANELPNDLNTATGLTAFEVFFTNTQNQYIFNNFKHTTQQLKNTDEGLRIQSDIINSSNNSFAQIKGQSLLNIYQKQSYTSTMSIPYGNIGVQPAQYYYLKNIKLFDGLYMIYNTTHLFDAETQRLETNFSGYRVKRDINRIIDEQFVRYNIDDTFLSIIDNIDNRPLDKSSKALTETETLSFYNKLLDSLKAPKTTGNILFLKAWRQSEGASARYNPFNTTLKQDGDTKFNRIGVKNYISFENGLQATIDTLTKGKGIERYKLLVDDLRKGIQTQEDARTLAIIWQRTGQPLAIWSGGAKGENQYVAQILKQKTIRTIPIYGNIN